MIVAGLAAGYLAVGVVIAALAARRYGPGDLVTLALLWPIYGPVLAERGPRPDDRDARIAAATRELAALDRVLARHAGADSPALAAARADQARRRASLEAIGRLRAAIATQLELAPWVEDAAAEAARLAAEVDAHLDALAAGNNPAASDVGP